MPRLETDGAEIAYEVRGDGPPLVLIHGSWADHETWNLISGSLAGSFRVITYSRRGHSLSTRPRGPMTRTDHVRDLVAVIERLAGGPAHLVGNSFGALVSLALISERPDLVLRLAAHEPPQRAPVGDTSSAPIHAAMRTIDEIIEIVRAGDAATATRRFMDEVVLGPGSWELISERDRQRFIGNAPEFVEDLGATAWSDLDLDAVGRFSGPFVITQGRSSPAWLRAAADLLIERLPNAGTVTLPGGHVPHFSHPQAYLDFLGRFLGADEAGG